jgi:serine/threonine protein kinase
MSEPSSITDIPDSIGPYKISPKSARGGMGVVYKAQDLRLDRMVALKVISDLVPILRAGAVFGTKPAQRLRWPIQTPAGSMTLPTNRTVSFS